jgi:hypothetical protein
LHSVVPPPTNLYFAVRRAVCLHSAVGQLLASCLVDTLGRCLDSDDEDEQMSAELFKEEMAAAAQDDLVEHIWRLRGNTN